MKIRNYLPEDYSAVEKLYKDSSTYGGQFDVARDTAERLNKLISMKSESILVAEDNGQIVGTVTLFEDGRSAWLYRFAVVQENEKFIAKALWEEAKKIMWKLGHAQVLVYAPTGGAHFEDRYTDIGFKKGNNFTAYWQNID